MRTRQREKIVKAWYEGPRLAWKRGTVSVAMQPYSKPNHEGGWLIPRYAARAFDRLFCRGKVTV